MKLLLGCVNSLVSLIGYDTDAQSSFWFCPANILRVCGLAYFDGGLVSASDNLLTHITPAGVQRHLLPGPHGNLAHTVQAYDDFWAVADTGNSRLLLRDAAGGKLIAYDPLDGWKDRPQDAIHLNDFIPWKNGFLASAFSYKPFHDLKLNDREWKAGKHGVIFHLYHSKGKTISRVVASGLSCPHSLREHEGKVYCCSSNEGTFIELAEHDNGQLYETDRAHITDQHFLRGALRHEGGWFLGGSSNRKSKSSAATLFNYRPHERAVEPLHVAKCGEIYEVLPWKEEIMEPLIETINSLPVVYEDGATYPPRVALGCD